MRKVTFAILGLAALGAVATASTAVLNRAGGGPDVRSGLSGLPEPVQLLRMPLHVAASVQRVGIGPLGTVRHQSIFCERASTRGRILPAASPRLLKSFG
jgi:hypothetical protein